VAALVAVWAIEQRGWGWYAGAGLALITGAAVSLAFATIVIARLPPGPPLAATTASIGLLLLLLAIEQRVWGIYPKPLRPPVGGTGFSVGGAHVSPTQVLAVGLALAVAVALTTFLRRTSFGLSIVAAAADRTEAALLGVPVGATSAVVWGMAGALAAMAALLFAPVVGAIGTGTMTLFFLRSLVAMMLGGSGSPLGVVLGGLAVGVVEQVTVRAFLHSGVPAVDTLAVFGLLLAVLWVRPRRLASVSA
jgi:branched-chain amino acid transport system permease protein